MRKVMLAMAGVAMFATAGVAVAHGIDGGKNVKAAAGTFTATAVGNSQTRSCTTTDGKAITVTSATYTGTAAGDADLTGTATFQVRSTINTTDGLGIVEGRLKIDASGGDTSAHFDGVYDHGTVVGLASGRAASEHAALLANISASFSSTTGFTGGKIGGGTAGGSAVEIGPANCASTKTIREKSEARGSVSAISSASLTVGGLTCAIGSDLATKTASLKVGDRAEIKCSLVSGVNTLTRIEAKH
jgi:hypothetical protein